MKCKLCLKEVDKLCESHIISELFYKPIYDEPHRFIAMTDNPDENNYYLQSGIKEKLLCKKCEDLIGKNEKYVKENFMSLLKNIDPVNNKGILFKQKFDYRAFKLFQLSILWRASVSSHIMFCSVKLGKDEEIIRKMVLEENPGRYYDYGCIMGIIRMGDRIGDSVMFSPFKNIDYGYPVYIFSFGGLYWMFNASEQSKENKFRSAYLQEDGSLLLSIMDFERMKYYTDFSDDVFAQGKLKPN